MRALSTAELQGLIDLSGLDEECALDDPRMESWLACGERGLAVYREEGEWWFWEINDLGRLALRVHYAVTSNAC